MPSAQKSRIDEVTGEDLTVTGNPLATKLAQVMASIHGRVARNGHNQHFDYRFTNEAGMYEACRDKIAELGIAIVPRVMPETIARREVGNKGEWLTELFVEFTVIDGESGVREIGCYPGAGTDKADKGAYKAVTGATKYFLQKLFLIPTGDDPENTSSEPTRQQGRELNAARPLQTAPPPAQAAPQATTAPSTASGPRPLGAPRQAAAQPAQAPLPAAAPTPAAKLEPVPPSTARPLGAPAATAARPIPTDHRPIVTIKSVIEQRRGLKPNSGIAFVLYKATTAAGQSMAVFDDEKGNVGSSLAEAAQRGTQVRLTVEDTQYGPKIIGFEVAA